MKRVYFVRHGETDSNVDGMFRGRAAQLTEAGKAQAAQVGERLKRLGVETLISSDYPRAEETATIIGEHAGLTHTPSALFGEWREPSSFGQKHKTDPLVAKGLEAIVAAHHEGDGHFVWHDEESFPAMRERAEEALALLAQQGTDRIAVVSHGGFLQVLMGTIVLGDDFSASAFERFMQQFAVHNCSITFAVLLPEGGWKLVTWNDRAHFE